MCLGVPGQIVAVWEEDGGRLATVDFAGEQRRIALAYLPTVGVGDHVIAHLGFAVSQLDEQTAAATLAMMREYDLLPAESVGGSVS